MNLTDPLAVQRFIYTASTPDAQWTWYVTEGSPVDKEGYYDTKNDTVDVVFFGYVIGDASELGYFSLSELERVRGAFGLPVERDVYFQPTRLSTILKGQQEG